MTTTAEIYESSPTKPLRRTKAEIGRLKATLYEVMQANQPMTVRQVFYQVVSLGAVDKTEQEYKGTACRLLAKMRRAKKLPFGWIADNTCWMRKPITFPCLELGLKRAVAYRRSLWDNQDVYVEMWLEKDALAGVLDEVTSARYVPLMVTRCYPSISYPYEAETIASANRPVFCTKMRSNIASVKPSAASL